MQKVTGMAWMGYFEKIKGFNGVLAFDLRTVLADALLMKVDKTTMAASLEARVPFLSCSMVEFALSLPLELKIKFLRSKWILRKLAEKKLPFSIAHRGKHGFWVPWEEWIRSENSRVDSAVMSSAFRDCGFFDAQNVVKSLHLIRKGGKEGDAGLLYRLVVLALWLERVQFLSKSARLGNSYVRT